MQLTNCLPENAWVLPGSWEGQRYMGQADDPWPEEIKKKTGLIEELTQMLTV